MRRRTVHGVAAAALAVVVSVGLVGCSGGASGGRPSEDEYRDALGAQMEKLGGGESGADGILDCLVGESYEQLSTETVRATVDGTAGHLPSQEDLDVLAAASKVCADAAVAGWDDRD